MKRFLVMILALALLISLCGCSLISDVTSDIIGADGAAGWAGYEECSHSFTVAGIYPAGCDYEGSVEVVCSICGDRYRAIQSSVGHDWAEADCTVPMTCRVCGATEGDVLMHTFSAGECTMCGAPDPENSITWDLSKGVLTLTGVGRMKDEAPWSDYRSSIKELIIADGITYIGRNAFSHSKIEKLVLPDSVRELGDRAFYWPYELTTVVLPDGIEVLPNSVFGQCPKLSSVKFPAGLKEIGYYAFGCSAIVELELPEGLEVIGETAFAYSYKLRTVTIPGTVIRMDKGAFKECSSLNKVVIREGVTSIGPGVFSYCDSLSEVHIPASVTQIDDYAFESSPKTVIYGKAGSYAEIFAAENNIPFVAG